MQMTRFLFLPVMIRTTKTVFTPWQDKKIILDKRDIIDRVNGFRNLLVVDEYTGWAEAVPANADDVKTVITF